MIGYLVVMFAGMIVGAMGRQIIVRNKDAWIKIGPGCVGMSPERASVLAADVHRALLKMSSKR